MTSLVWFTPLLCAASLFNVQVIPLEADAYPFLAQAASADNKHAGAVYVLRAAPTGRRRARSSPSTRAHRRSAPC